MFFSNNNAAYFDIDDSCGEFDNLNKAEIKGQFHNTLDEMYDFVANHFKLDRKDLLGFEIFIKKENGVFKMKDDWGGTRPIIFKSGETIEQFLSNYE